MKNNDNFRTTKHDNDYLGSSQKDSKTEKKTSPKEADRESLNTPKENEVYVDLEPDELHLSEEPVEEIKEKKKK